jgi:16S rRNA (cytosine967-C5)-methyltransferase
VAPRKPRFGGNPPRSAMNRGDRSRAPVDPVRDAALQLLMEFEEKGFPAGGRIEQVQNRFAQERDRGLFRLLVTEVLRHRLKLDTIIEEVLEKRSLSELEPPVRAALRLGTAQLLLVPGMAPHAAVNTSVDLAAAHGHKGTASLVNAVLRRISREDSHGSGKAEPRSGSAAVSRAGARDDVRQLAQEYSHPEWLVRRFLARWGPARTQKVLEWDNLVPDYWIRLHPRSVAPPGGSVSGWVPGTARLPAGSRPAQLAGFFRGEWTIQDGSGTVVGLLVPEVRAMVVDLCAAPGTKTGHLMERADPATRVIALDRSHGRMRRLRTGIERLQFSADVQLECIAADSRRIPVREPWQGVLIDAPCSNLGVIRRRVDVRWRAREDEIPRLAAVQAELIRAGAKGVAPGGWLTYSVCTLEPEETTAHFDTFFSDGLWEPVPLPPWVPPEARGREGELVLIPGELETDGTYAFVARRTGGGERH